MIKIGEIPLFITYIETKFNSKNISVSDLNSLLNNYANLDYMVSREDKIKKETIDIVFQTLYGMSLETMIETFNVDKTLIKIESEESKLRKRVADLEETIGELREAYWVVKHRNMKE